jgi:TonB family protein
LHLLLLLFFVSFDEKLKFPPPQSQEKKISLNLQHFVTPPPAPKPVTPPTQPVVTPPKPIIKEEQQPVTQSPQKKVLDTREKTFALKSNDENNVTKPAKKIVKKEAKKPVKKVVKKTDPKKIQSKNVQPKRVVQKTPPRQPAQRSNSALAKSLLAQGSSMSPSSSRRASSGSYASKMIKQLYGGEFNTYSPAQKEFIENNLGTIHQITQRTLTLNGYPAIAVRTRQQGTNVVSFYLHPNGDISDLRLKRRIGYESLDQNTLEVIRIAYKDYPLPNKKTKIMFYVQYSLY